MIDFNEKLPKGWDWLKIEDICHIGRGRVISKKEIIENTGDYPVYSSQTFNDGIFGYLNTYNFDGEYVTWTTDGAYAGTVFYRNGKFNCTNVCGTLNAKYSNIDMKLLSIILNNFTKSEVFIASGNPKLMNNVMAKIKIPFPLKLDEQQRLVKIIETKFNAVEKAKILIFEQIQIVEKTYHSFVECIYNNDKIERVKLGKITEVNPSTKDKVKKDENIDVSFIPMEAIDAKDGKVKVSITKKLKDVKKGYTYFEENDVLFAKITPCMQNGKSAVANNLTNGIGYGSTEFHVIRSNNCILPEWIHYFIRQKKYLQNAINYMTGSVGHQRLPDKYLSETMIPLPNINEQKNYISYLKIKFDILNSIYSNLKNQLSYFNALSSSILRKAFNGEY